MPSSRTIFLTHHHPEGCREVADEVAVEEPLEIRLDGHPVAVVMRTPGHDGELALGFLISEGIIPNKGTLRKTEPRPDENRILLFLHDGVGVDLAKLTRHFFTGSSCGLCGKATLDAILCEFPPIGGKLIIPDNVILSAPAKLRAAQDTFQTTGGLHAAALFSAGGDLLVCREDIGRHNAVDKVIGHALLNDIDPETSFLLVSGRLSFEIMQKSLAARIPVVAAISAPSSLAVDFAKNSGQALIGFLRPPVFNRYA
ncbi:formate dehydrogenase accessory sulfurtransferase FdhD [Luteolibacter yonseiensis]|uniref:Sulfur carrier protein FdhD n=1 Tax=Luteolibacter yonseiensis TaxID=1144680 RepID=A0A934R7C1_9BACT|nr:formate dehydrogenase accessory sulfurtransferase FdhD [Luteolibacter yonseiensis]MBK1818367.1 formate dehydrogenase accessory sulfurtransferase FdhD [Luteolibacter yonseiensis]